MIKTIVIYLSVLVVLGSSIALILAKGSQLPVKQETQQAAVKAAPNAHVEGASWTDNLRQPLVLALLQIVIILALARAFGFLAQAVKQPVVVGEVVAGICLGPSLLGWVLPEFSKWLFAPGSIQSLTFLSQVGLLFFMFVVGMDLEVASLKQNKRQAVIISHVSILFPFFLGVALAYYMYPLVAPPATSFLSFALFIGIAMSITAFPVLARIIHERGLHRTALGNLALTCAAADDITAWCILAVVVAIAKAQDAGSSLLITIGSSLVYIFLMLYPVKKWVRSLMNRYTAAGKGQAVTALSFVLMLLSAWATEAIGIHALFGAFLAGIIMPPGKATREMVKEKVKDFSMLLLLPIFFVCVGFNTQVNLVGGPQLWLLFVAIMLVAVVGKLGGSAIAARSLGLSWRTAWSVGALMNTRGLVELVVLNIGFELGILTQDVFTLMVLMAVVTTFMTGPLLYLAYRVETPPVSIPDIIPLPAEEKLVNT